LEIERTRYKNVAEELRSQLETLPPMEGRFWAADSTEEIAVLLADRLESADDEVLITATTTAGGLFGLEPVYARTVEEFATLLDSGVAVKILFTKGLVIELPERVVSEVERLFQEYTRFELRTTSNLYNTYDMIDRGVVCVYVADPFDRDSILGTVQIADPEFVERVDERRRLLWNNATEVESLSHTTS
jgi:sugar-specific transcriptional regulator TrmB